MKKAAFLRINDKIKPRRFGKDSIKQSRSPNSILKQQPMNKQQRRMRPKDTVDKMTVARSEGGGGMGKMGEGRWETQSSRSRRVSHGAKGIQNRIVIVLCGDRRPIY